MSTFVKTAKTKIKRLPKRGSYDRETIYGIIDEALICHVGFTMDCEPYVVPTAIARVDNDIYIHGSRVSRMLKHLAQGEPACIVVTHLDGLVLARSGFHHSMNYRSVIIFGNGVSIVGPDKRNILDTFVNRLIPGRFELNEVSAKIRSGPPADDMEDYDLPIWAGELPLGMKTGKPVTDPDMKMEVPVPAYVKKYKR